MNWLYTKEKSVEVDKTVPKGLDEVKLKEDNFFEFDDDTTGVDIDGFLFFPREVSGDESFSHREFIRTKIMSGGEFVTRGQYIPREFSFDTYFELEKPEKYEEYRDVFSKMENRVCRITSPYMGGMFKGEVNVNVTNPESSPHIIECTVKIKEIPDAMARLPGDPVISYPSINTISDVGIKDRGTTKKDDKKDKKKDVYDAKNSSESRRF